MKIKTKVRGGAVAVVNPGTGGGGRGCG